MTYPQVLHSGNGPPSVHGCLLQPSRTHLRNILSGYTPLLESNAGNSSQGANALRRTFKLLVVHSLLLLAFAATAQIPPIKPAPLSQQVPQGSGACSVQKSCAELAPTMIQAALGPSPLEENLRYLTDTIGGRVTGTASADRSADWAVQAFRHAGVDDVHTKNFPPPVGGAGAPPHREFFPPPPFPVRLFPIGGSPATPEGGVT